MFAHSAVPGAGPSADKDWADKDWADKDWAHSDWLDELNDAQRRAATESLERPLLILAGAGSGKTATLAARVAWLIASGVAPERILLLTFTRRAALELLTRTRGLLDRAGVAAHGNVVGGTFHSVAWRLVRLYA